MTMDRQLKDFEDRIHELEQEKLKLTKRVKELEKELKKNANSFLTNTTDAFFDQV